MHAEQDARRSKWASTVSEFKNSGLTQADFCKSNNLKFKQFIIGLENLNMKINR